MTQRASSLQPFVFTLAPTLEWTELQTVQALGAWQDAQGVVDEAQSLVASIAADLRIRAEAWRLDQTDPRQQQERASFLTALRGGLAHAQNKLELAKKQADQEWQAWQKLQLKLDSLVELRCQLRDEHELMLERSIQAEQDRDWLARRDVVRCRLDMGLHEQ